jgi:EAL and modified HD-GYP domain-containing signal transduction protein
MARNPLIHTVAARARSMELLAGRAAQSNREAADRAFMVGMLSLLDVIWKVPMAQIVSQLPLDARVKDALTQRSGYDGKLLQLIECKEANDMQAVASVMRDLDNVTWQQLSETDWQAVLWADQLSQI